MAAVVLGGAVVLVLFFVLMRVVLGKKAFDEIVEKHAKTRQVAANEQSAPRLDGEEILWDVRPRAIGFGGSPTRHFGNRLTLTTRRIVLQRGLLAKDVTSLRYEDVRAVRVSQSVLQRLIGSGDIEISTSASIGGTIVVRELPNVHTIAQVIRERQAV